MRGPRFDPTINLGHVMTATGFLIAGLAAYQTTRDDITRLQERQHSSERSIERLAASVEQLTSILTTYARQDERLQAVERRLDRVERTPAGR